MALSIRYYAGFTDTDKLTAGSQKYGVFQLLASIPVGGENKKRKEVKYFIPVIIAAIIVPCAYPERNDSGSHLYSIAFAAKHFALWNLMEFIVCHQC